MKKLIIIFILSVSGVGFSQSYYDSQKQNREYKSLQQSTARAFAVPERQSTNTSSYQSSSSNSSTANSSNSNSYKSSGSTYSTDAIDAEKARREQYGRDKYLKDRQDKQENDRMAAKQKIKDEDALYPYKVKLAEARYTRGEINKIISRYDEYLLGRNPYSYANDMLNEFNNLLNYPKKVYQNYKTASFETLKTDVEFLIKNGFVVSALKSIKLTELRFADKKNDLQELYGKLFATTFSYSRYHLSQHEINQFTDLYLKFEDANPEIYNCFRTKPDDLIGNDTPYELFFQNYSYADKNSKNNIEYRNNIKNDKYFQNYKELQVALDSLEPKFEAYKKREALVSKETFKGYYSENSKDGDIKYYNSDKKEISFNDFIIRKFQIYSDFTLEYGPNVSIDLIKKLADLRNITPALLITKHISIEPKVRFELYFKMAEQNIAGSLQEAYNVEKEEIYKEKRKSYHLKNKWYSFLEKKALEGNSEAMTILFQVYSNDTDWHSKKTVFPMNLEKTFNDYATKAPQNEVFTVAKIWVDEYIASGLKIAKVPKYFDEKIYIVGINAVQKLAEQGYSEAIELAKKIKIYSTDCDLKITESTRYTATCGTETAANGNKYMGEFKNGLYHGFGKYTWTNGTFYEGNYVNGKRHGQGILQYTIKNKYEGNFKDDTFEGFGKYIYSDGSIYIGNFVKDNFQGKGTLTYSNGSIYEGDFVNNSTEGKGKLSWTDGSFYEGDFKKDQRTGTGVYTYPNGDTYEGVYLNGAFNGTGKHSKKSGYYSVGVYKNGVAESINYFNPSKSKTTKDEFDQN